ncbi:MAG: Rieske 2Fe-2S domain-containing protein [Gammaproteobacteria bacterium]|nr:Rieske 2Fe-2S domain-containing protein [Gammaproteobacteria bacterium]
MSGRPHMICRLEDIPESSGRGCTVWLPAAPRRSDIFLVRRGRLVRAYHNCCPHKGLTLDWVADRFMDPAGEYIQCANHDALFRVEDGYCVRGPCAGMRLRSVPVRVNECGEVELGESGSA